MEGRRRPQRRRGTRGEETEEEKEEEEEEKGVRGGQPPISPTSAPRSILDTAKPDLGIRGLLYPLTVARPTSAVIDQRAIHT